MQTKDRQSTTPQPPHGRRSVLVNFSWLGGGLMASRLLQFGVVVYLTRILGDAAYGRFAFVQAFLWFGIILTDFGFTQIGTREVAKNPRRLKTLASVITFGRLVICAAELLLILTIPLALPMDWQLYWLFAYSFLSVAVYATTTDWVLRGMEKMEYVAIWEALPRLIWLVGALLFVHSPQDLLKVPLLRLVGEVVTAGILIATTWRRYPNSRPSLSLLHPLNIKLLGQEALPIMMAALLAQVYYSFDTILLGFLRSDAEVGQYSAAYRVVTLLMTGAFLLAATYQPVLGRCFAADRRTFLKHLQRLSLAAMVLGIVLPALVAVAAGPLVRLLYGQPYMEAAMPLAILMISVPFAYVGIVYTTALVAAGRQRQMMIATAIGAGSNVIANLLLIPPFGMTGAAEATILSYVIASAIQWWHVRKLSVEAR